MPQGPQGRPSVHSRLGPRGQNPGGPRGPGPNPGPGLLTGPQAEGLQANPTLMNVIQQINMRGQMLMRGPPPGPMGPRGPFPDDMNMGPLGPSGPMRPMGGPDGELGGASPGHLPVSSSGNSPQTSAPGPGQPSCSLDSPSMTTTAPSTGNSSGDPSLGFNDPSTPDPSRLEGSQSPSLQDSASLSGK